MDFLLGGLRLSIMDKYAIYSKLGLLMSNMTKEGVIYQLSPYIDDVTEDIGYVILSSGTLYWWIKEEHRVVVE